jgi:hypothetical protein
MFAHQHDERAEAFGNSPERPPQLTHLRLSADEGRSSARQVVAEPLRDRLLAIKTSGVRSHALG